METRKLVVKIAYGLIGLLVVVLIGLGIYQQRLIKQLSGIEETTLPTGTEAVKNATAQAQNKDMENGASAGGDREPLGNEIDALKYHLDAAEEELEMTQEELSSELDRQAEQARNNIELQKKMLQNPAMKKMIRTNMKGATDLQYGDLFAELGLSDEKLETFKELLTVQQMQSLDIAMEMMDQSLPEEKKKENLELFEARKTEFDNQVNALLGTDNFEIYDTYRERIRERQYATTFAVSLGTDEGLTDTQKQDLIDAMYEARQSVEVELGIDAEERKISLNESDMKNQLERMNLTFERYIESAEETLSETQSQKFETHMKEQQEIMEMSLKMAGQLFGNRTAE